MQIENCSLLATSLHSSAIILKQRPWANTLVHFLEDLQDHDLQTLVLNGLDKIAVSIFTSTPQWQTLTSKKPQVFSFWCSWLRSSPTSVQTCFGMRTRASCASWWHWLDWCLLKAIVASFQYMKPLLRKATSRFVLARNLCSCSALMQRWRKAASHFTS